MSEKKLSKFLLKSDGLYLTLNKGEALNNTIPGKFQTYIAFGKPIISNSMGVSNNIIKMSKIGYSNSPGDYKKLYNNLIKVKKITLSEKKNIYNRSRILYMKYFELNKNIDDLEKILRKYKN